MVYKYHQSNSIFKSENGKFCSRNVDWLFRIPKSKEMKMINALEIRKIK